MSEPKDVGVVKSFVERDGKWVEFKRPESVSPARLEEIKNRIAAATPGPWTWSGCANDRVDVCSNAPGWQRAEIAVVTVDYDFNNRDGLVDGMPVMDRAMAHDNAALIMAAPKDLQDLVAEVERLRAELHRQRLEIQSHDCGYGETGPGLIHCPIDKPCTLHQLERLREVVRRVHGLAGKGNDPTHGWVDSDLYEIHKLTKGEE